MDEPSVTRVPAQPSEPAAERGDRRHQPKSYSISLRLSSPFSGKHLCGLLLEFLRKHGDDVQSIRVRPDVGLLAAYDKARDGR